MEDKESSEAPVGEGINAIFAALISYKSVQVAE